MAGTSLLLTVGCSGSDGVTDPLSGASSTTAASGSSTSVTVNNEQISLPVGGIRLGGRVWVASESGVLLSLSPNSLEILSTTKIPGGVSFASGLLASPDRREIWLVTSAAPDLDDPGPALRRIDVGTGNVRSTPLRDVQSVGQVFTQGGQLVAADLQRGITFIDAATGSRLGTVTVRPAPLLVQPGAAARVWTATEPPDARVRLYTQSGRVVVAYDKPSLSPRSITADGRGGVWIAGGSSVAHLDRSGRPLLELSGFANAVRVSVCDGRTVVTDIDRGLTELTGDRISRQPLTDSTTVLLACDSTRLFWATEAGQLGATAY